MSQPKDLKPIIFTKRDQDFLVDMYDLQFVDVEYLQQNIYKGNSKSFIYRRVNRLEAEGYVKSFRVPLMDPNPNGQSKNVYALDRRGAEEVKHLLGEIDWRYDVAQRTPTHIHHQLLLGHVRAAFEEDRDMDEDERIPKHDIFELAQYINEKHGYFKSEKSEYSKYMIRPDAILVLKNKVSETYAPFMVELERSRQSKKTTIEKLERYEAYARFQLYNEHLAYDYPVGKPRILFICYDPKGVDRLLDHSKDVDTSFTNGVLFTTYEQVMNDPYGLIFRAKDSTDPTQFYSLTDRVE